MDRKGPGNLSCRWAEEPLYLQEIIGGNLSETDKPVNNNQLLTGLSIFCRRAGNDPARIFCRTIK
jgi:hypothetical protein